MSSLDIVYIIALFLPQSAALDGALEGPPLISTIVSIGTVCVVGTAFCLCWRRIRGCCRRQARPLNVCASGTPNVPDLPHPPALLPRSPPLLLTATPLILSFYCVPESRWKRFSGTTWSRSVLDGASGQQKFVINLPGLPHFLLSRTVTLAAADNSAPASAGHWAQLFYFDPQGDGSPDWRCFSAESSCSIMSSLLRYDPVTYSVGGHEFEIDRENLQQVNIKTKARRSLICVFLCVCEDDFCIIMPPSRPEYRRGNVSLGVLDTTSALQALEPFDDLFLSVAEQFRHSFFLDNPGCYPNITAIHQVNPPQHQRDAFASALKTCCEVRQAHKADVQRVGWHSSDLQSLVDIAQNGWMFVPKPRNGRKFGNGIYLGWQAKTAHSYSIPDFASEHHMLQFQIVCGELEEMQLNSEAFHASNKRIDCMGRDPSNTMCIVWNQAMNSHTLPTFLVSYILGAPTVPVAQDSPIMQLGSLHNVSTSLAHSHDLF